MKLAFEQDDTARRIRGTFCLSEDFQGGGGYLHGGIIALVLDEAMGKLSRFTGVRAPTAELQVEYKRPIRAGQEILVEAHEIERAGRDIYRASEIRDSEGKVLARGRARFVDVGDAGKDSLLAAEGIKGDKRI